MAQIVIILYFYKKVNQMSKTHSFIKSCVPGCYYSQVKTDLEVFGNSRGSVFQVTKQ